MRLDSSTSCVTKRRTDWDCACTVGEFTSAPTTAHSIAIVANTHDTFDFLILESFMEFPRPGLLQSFCETCSQNRLGLGQTSLTRTTKIAGRLLVHPSCAGPVSDKAEVRGRVAQGLQKMDGTEAKSASAKR